MAGDGPSFFTSLVLFAPGKDQTPLLKICQKAADNETKQKALEPQNQAVSGPYRA